MRARGFTDFGRTSGVDAVRHLGGVNSPVLEPGITFPSIDSHGAPPQHQRVRGRTGPAPHDQLRGTGRCGRWLSQPGRDVQRPRRVGRVLRQSGIHRGAGEDHGRRHGAPQQGGLELHLSVCDKGVDDDQNILMDFASNKYPGHTHASFVVPNVAAARTYLEGQGIAISGDRTRAGKLYAVFARDPDRTTLEFERNHGEVSICRRLSPISFVDVFSIVGSRRTWW